MSSPTWAIGSAYPTTIFRRQQKQTAYNVYNIGSNDVYIDDSPQAPNTVSGVPLHPGAQLTWEAGRECYAICATGLSSTLLTSPAAGGYFDPYTLATNILTLAPSGLTLAQQIANELNLVGVPPIDRMAVLYQDVRVVTTPNPINYVPTLDVSAYPSVFIYIYDQPTAAYTGTAIRPMTIQWEDPSGVNLMDVRRYDMSNANGSVQAHLRCRGSKMLLFGNPVGRNSTVGITILGSYKPLPAESIYMQNGIVYAGAIAPTVFDPTTNIFSYSGVTGGAATYSAAPDFLVGDYNLYFSTTQNCTLQIRDANSLNDLYKFSTVAGTPTLVPVPLHLGPMTYEVALTVPVATAYNIAFSRCGSE